MLLLRDSIKNQTPDLDGVQAGTLSTTAVPSVTSEGPTAGRHASCGYYSTATIDEIAFHQVELSAAEIQARVAAGSAGYCDPPDADLLVKTAAEGLAGYLANDFRETSPPSVQVKSITVAPFAAAEFQVKVENDSDAARSFVLRTLETGSDGWTRVYEGAGGSIGSALKGSGGYETAVLAPGAAEVITVRLTPGSAVTGGFTMTSTLSVLRDAAATGARDVVQVRATCAPAALADMLVRRASDLSFLGDDIRNQDGANQGKTSEVAAGQSARFFARISNDGNVPTRFRLRTAAPTGDWTMQCSGSEPGLNFDGINDAVRVPDVPALRPASLTVEGWFRATVTSGARTFVAKGFGTQDWDSYVVWIDNGTLWAGVMDNTGRIDRLSFNWNSLPAGWHHVAMTFDEATDVLRLFVDGVQRGQMTSTLAIVYDAHPLTIGCDTNGTAYPYPMAGQALEVRLWNRARTPAEIQAAMSTLLTGSETGLVGLWPLTDGAGLVANDPAGGHHGELINGATWLFTGSTDLTTKVASPAGWSEAVLSPGQSYDLGVTLTAAAALPAGSRCDVLVEGANVSGIPATSDVVRLSALVPEGGTSGEPVGRTFTGNDDFDNSQSTLVGVEFSSVPNQLQLGRTLSALPFLWVPNSNQGTISKVDTRTGRELGRYRVCPETVASYANPSRTTVDLHGHCWVGNRQIGSAVKVGLYESGGHFDRNGDGIIQTSADTNDNGVIEGAELLPWGSDECVLWEVIIIPGKEGTFAPGTYTAGYANDYWNPGPRGIAIDAAGDLWLGSFGIRKYHKIDGDTGAILKAIDVSTVNHTPYGAVIDRNGILWSSGSDKQHVLRLNTQTETFQAIALGHHSYGMALDNAGHLFVSGWENTKLSRIDIVSGVKEWTLNGVYQSRGVAVTPDGNVWTANSGPGTVTRFSNDGAIKATIEAGNQPTGVAVDADGKVWSVDVGDEYVKRIDPATNAVDLAKALPGTNHYGYSDMTGFVARNATTRFGTWTVIHDSGAAGALWQSVGWTSLEPEGQGLTVRLRTSADGTNWSAWVPATNDGSLAGLPAGRYLQVEAFFQVVPTATGEQSPVLYDLTVTPAAGGAQKLTVSLGAGNTVVLSALGSPDDWVLERSTTLRAGEWQDLPFVPQLVPGGFTITVERDVPRAFFRLRRK